MTDSCRAILCLLLAILLAWAGCASSPTISEAPFPPGEPLVAPGTADLENIHLPSVMVSASIVTDRGRLARKLCSGVIVHPRLVLTAGHCVCAPRAATLEDRFAHLPGVEAAPNPQADRVRKSMATRESAIKDFALTTIVDAKSSCAATVAVTTVKYTSRQPALPATPEIHDHLGKVVVHPDFEMIAGRRGRAQGVVWSNADLAAIFLREPLEDTMPRLSLTDVEVQEGQAITMVGYTSGDDASPIYGVRYFGVNRVTHFIPMETGSAIFRTEEQQLPDGRMASHAQGGDSGGACVKGTDKNVLLGITTVGADNPLGGRMSVFTSVYSHRGWLLEMLQKADES